MSLFFKFIWNSKIFLLLILFYLFLNNSLRAQTTDNFTVPGTYSWTVPACVTEITVQVWGGGGGGGGSISIMRSSNDSEACSGAGGGGGGGFSERTFSVIPGQTYTVTVGDGGIGGASGNGTSGSGITTPPSVGGNGGASSFIGHTFNIAATGGIGGNPAGAYNNNNDNDVNAFGTGGAGGVGSGGILNFNGGNGAAGLLFNFSTDKSGGGGGAAGPGGNGGNAPLANSYGIIDNFAGGTGNAPGGNGGSARMHNLPSNAEKIGGNGGIIGGGGGGGLTHKEGFGVVRAVGGNGARGEVRVTYNAPTPTTPTFAAVAPICSGEPLAALPTTSLNGINGTWAPALDNTNTTTYTFTPGAGECANQVDLTITVNPIPTAPVIGLITQPTCTVPTGTVALSGLPSSGSWTVTAAPGGATITGSGTTANFGGLAPNQTYTFTVTNSGNCTSSASLDAIVNAIPPNPTAPILGTITQPTCLTPTGSVALSGLPAGNWTITASPGGSTQNSSGASSVFSGLAPGDNYTFVVTDDNGCSSPASLPAIVNALPASPSAPTIASIIQPTCTEATATVDLSGLPAAGNWDLTITPGGTVVNSSGTTYSWTSLGDDETYTFVVTDDNGCSSVSSANAVVNPQPQTPAVPVIDNVIQPTCTVATGSVEFSNLPATGNWTLTTNPGGLTFVSNGTTGTFAGLPASSSFTFTVTNADGCTSSSTGSAAINAQPVTPSAPVVGAITQPTCSAPTGSVGLSGLPTGNWTLTSTPGGLTQNNTGAATTFTGLAPDDTYTFTVTNDEGCTSVASLPADIDPIPNAPSAPTIANIIQPTCTEATATVDLSGLPAAGNWDLTITPGGTVVNSSGTTYSWTGLGDDETYTFVVTDDNGCSSVSSANAVVNPQPQTPAVPVIDNVIQPTCTVATGSVEFSNLPATGNWTLTTNPGGLTFVSNGTTGTFAGLPASSSFTFTVTNADGCTSSSTGSAAINAQPVTPSAPVVGAITQPTCSAPTGSVGLSGLPTGNWTLTSTPGGLTQNNTGAATTFTGLAPDDTYTFTVTNDEGCTSVASLPADIDPIPNAPSAPTIANIIQPTCTEATATVDLSGLPAAGNWDLTITPGGTVVNSSGTTYSWTGLGDDETYTFVVTDDNGCSSVSSANAVVNPQPQTPAVPVIDNVIQPTCTVATGSVEFSNLPATGNWTLTVLPDNTNIVNSGGSFVVNGLTDNTTYTFEVTNDEGCTSITTAAVAINAQPQTPDAPIIDNQVDPTCLVPTGSVVMSGLPSGDWELTALPSGTTLNGSTTTATFSGLQPGDSYTFTVTNADGCTSVESLEITVADIPNNPAAPDVTVITQPTCTQPVGSVEVTDLSGGTVEYSINGVDFQGSETFTGLAPGTYNVVIQDVQTGCISASTQVTIDPVPTAPDAPILSEGGVYCSGDDITLLSVLNADPNESYSWYSDENLSDLLGTGDTYAPIDVIGETTYYVVALEGDCQSAASSVMVLIEDCSIDDIVVPGGFTPNDDGVNDNWEIVGIDDVYPNNIVFIYNRWGNLLFESEQGSYSTSMWDGSYNGSALPVGSYYYMILTDGTNSGEILKGTVSIVKN